MREERSNFARTHLPCPCGVSSDGYAIREDGSGYCFSGNCEGERNFQSSDHLDIKVKRKRFKKYEEELTDKFIAKPFAHRGIYEKTFDRFGVLTKFLVEDDKETPVETGFRYPNGAIKIRDNHDKKKIRSTGPMSEATLFGKNFFDKGKCITIVEGEYDMLAAAQILGDASVVVTVRSASSAKKDCSEEWEYINSFDKIVINMDNDAAGQKAAKEILPLFDFKKTYNLVLERHKDANAYLWDNDKQEEVNEGKLYYDAWKTVKRHTPDNIVSGNSSFKQALQQEREACIATYPTEDLQSKLHGIHHGEVVVILAPEGVGKTETFRFIEDHVIKTTKVPLGIIHLEEDNGTTLRGMAAYYSNEPVHLPDTSASVDDVFKIIEQINGKTEDRIFLRSAFDVEDEDAFINGVRFLVSVCGCKAIFLDHISWLATGEDNQDERKKLDRISQRLKLLAKELGFALIMISHVNDDGKSRGSRNITKVANTVIEISRDLTHADETERNKTHFTIRKARLMGAKSGPAGYALYDSDVGILKAPYGG